MKKSKKSAGSSESTQTDESSLTTCESCVTAIEMIKKLITEVEACVTETEAAEGKGEASSEITNERQFINENLLKITQWCAMRRWTCAIMKDVKCIIVNAKEKQSRNNSLRNELEKSESNLRLLKSQCEELENKNRTYENRLENSTRMKNEMELKNEQFIKNTHVLELKIQYLQETIVKDKKNIEKMEAEFHLKLNKLLEEKNSKLEATIKECNELKLQILKYEKNKNELENKMFTQQNELNKIRLNFENDLKSVKTAFASENSKLKMDLEIIQNQIKEKNDVFLEKQKNYETKYNELKSQLQNLTQELEISKERESNLLNYPDLTTPAPEKTKTTKGDPIFDMQQQIIANGIRINLLNEQNEKLNKTISRLQLITDNK